MGRGGEQHSKPPHLNWRERTEDTREGYFPETVTWSKKKQVVGSQGARKCGSVTWEPKLVQRCVVFGQTRSALLLFKFQLLIIKSKHCLFKLPSFFGRYKEKRSGHSNPTNIFLREQRGERLNTPMEPFHLFAGPCRLPSLQPPFWAGGTARTKAQRLF